MMDQITDRDRVEPVIEEVFEVTGKTNEEMLVRTLSEILYLHHAEKLVFKEIELDLKEGGKLTCTIKGEEVHGQSKIGIICTLLLEILR